MQPISFVPARQVTHMRAGAPINADIVEEMTGSAIGV